MASELTDIGDRGVEPPESPGLSLEELKQLGRASLDAWNVWFAENLPAMREAMREAVQAAVQAAAASGIPGIMISVSPDVLAELLNARETQSITDGELQRLHAVEKLYQGVKEELAALGRTHLGREVCPARYPPEPGETHTEHPQACACGGTGLRPVVATLNTAEIVKKLSEMLSAEPYDLPARVNATYFEDRNELKQKLRGAEQRANDAESTLEPCEKCGVKSFNCECADAALIAGEQLLVRITEMFNVNGDSAARSAVAGKNEYNEARFYGVAGGYRRALMDIKALFEGEKS